MPINERKVCSNWNFCRGSSEKETPNGVAAENDTNKTVKITLS